MDIKDIKKSREQQNEIIIKANLIILFGYMIFIVTVIFIIFQGMNFHNDIKNYGYLEPVVYSAKLNGVDTQVVCGDKGCFTSVNYEYCREKWGIKNICDRENLNVLIRKNNYDN